MPPNKEPKYGEEMPDDLSGDKTLLGYKLPAAYSRPKDEDDDESAENTLNGVEARQPAQPARPVPAARPATISRPGMPAAARPTPAPLPAQRPAAAPPRPAAAPRMGPPAGSRPVQPRPAPPPKFFPAEPKTIKETGLTESAFEEMCLKALFFAGEMRTVEVCRKLKLPLQMVEDTLEGLRKGKLVDIKGGSGGIGKSQMIYVCTSFSREVLQQILDRNRYNGPAPVPYTDYIAALKAQTIRGTRITKQMIADKFEGLIIRDYIYEGVGPAMNSGKAIFFYGLPGNGKTAVCQCMTNCFEGEIFIPYAVSIDGFVVKLFDDVVHKAVPWRDGEQRWDERWVRCRRPLVVVGGELTLEMLDMSYSSEVKFYEAPIQMKAGNGMLLIDDFGRQKVAPKDLLNRWIVPLESEVDYLQLVTGKKFSIPFDVFVVFSTNLDPASLVDDAFLRRVRYKLEVQSPDEQLFKEIFASVCESKGVPYDESAIDYLIRRHYRGDQPRKFAACHPRDLMAQIIDNANFRDEEPLLTPEAMDRVAKSYFVRFSD
jgi:hypothetical protein